ncbi:MAG: septum formation initiator family protein [Actinomycetota bacterium]
MSRSKTTSIKRPDKLPTAAEEGESRLGDLSRPIPVDKRIFRRSKVALVAGVGALVVGLALAAAVFVLPLQTWFDQDDALAERQAQLDELQRVNGQLAAEVDRLRTDDGVREAAREEIGYVEDGEERFSVRPFPLLPRTLPSGWPYNVSAQIIALRQNPPPEPVESTERGDQVESTEQGDQVDPVAPVESVAPAESEAPAEPVAPVDSTAPLTDE